MFIQIKNLTKIYNKYFAVNKIDFQIKKNMTLGLLGPNGCGKTTTIGMILGLVTPTSGEILIDDQNINTFSRDQILKRFNFASPIPILGIFETKILLKPFFLTFRIVLYRLEAASFKSPFLLKLK